MSVVVFGANGYIGRNLIHELSKNSGETIALSRSFDQSFFANYPEVICNSIDYRDPISYVDFVKEGDTVVHLIYLGIPFQAHSDKKCDILNNLIPSVELAEHCADKGVKRFIFSSSGGTVYGETSDKILNEEDHCDPVNSYGITKLATEKYIRAISRERGMDHAILRISNPYGGLSNPNSPVGLFARIERCLTDDMPFQLRVPIDTIRDYVPIEEVIDAFVRIIDFDGPINDTFNVSSGRGLSVGEVIEMLEKKHCKKLSIKMVCSSNPEVRCNVLDNSKLHNFLAID